MIVSALLAEKGREMIVDIKAIKSVLKPEEMAQGRADEGVINMFDHDDSPKEGDFKVCLVAPVTYFAGAGMMGLQIIRNVIAATEGVFADYSYFPTGEVREVLRKQRIPWFGFRSKETLRTFDMLGFSMFFMPNLFNVIQILRYSGIPYMAKDRDDSYPLIIGGGVMTSTPEPFATIFDIVFIGEGEDGVPEMIRTYRECKAKGMTKREALMVLMKIPGVYVPSFYEPYFDPETKRYAGMKKLVKDAPNVVYWQKVDITSERYNYTIARFDDTVTRNRLYLTKDIEVTRGCAHACRFCAPGYWYRPYRERNYQGVIEAINARKPMGMVRFMGLTPTDHSRYNDFSNYALDNGLSYDGYSERIDRFKDVMKKGRRMRSTCFAIETATEKLRRSVNKHISQRQYWDGMAASIASGVIRNKTMIMIGLPYEKMSDVKAIHDMFDEVFRMRQEIRPEAHVELSVNPFIVKAHTPYQWMEYKDSDYFDYFVKRFNERYHDNRYLVPHERTGMPVIRGWQNVKGSKIGRKIEGLFEMGDRRIVEALVAATIHFNLMSEQSWGDTVGRVWNDIRSFVRAKHGYDIEDFLRPKEFYEPLPWDHISMGVDKSWLWEENLAASQYRSTETCFDGCTTCGVITNVQQNQGRGEEAGNRDGHKVIANSVCGFRPEDRLARNKSDMVWVDLDSDAH